MTFLSSTRSVFNNFIVLVVLASLFGFIASFAWLNKGGVILNIAAYSGLFALIPRRAAWQAGVIGFAFASTKLSVAFWWATQMLSYTLNTEGLIPKLVFSGMVLWESIPFAIVAILTTLVYRTSRLLAFSFWGLSLAGIPTLWPRVFRWDIGHIFLDHLPLAQLAEFGGGALVTLLYIAISFIPFLLYGLVTKSNSLKERERNASYLLLTLVTLAYLWGANRQQQIDSLAKEAEKIRVGCAQAYPADVTSIDTLKNLSATKLADADLLCWPESTLGVHSDSLTHFRDEELVFQHSIEPFVDASKLSGVMKPLLVGGRCFEDEKSDDVPCYQTAFLLDENANILSKYHKRGLMPLGEYVPGESHFPFLHDWFQLDNYFIAGQDSSPLVLPDGTRLGVLVCYEDTSPRIVRETAQNEADFFVCIINASAFHHPDALRQHLRLAMLRSIENRKYLLRASGTGITCGVSPTGELITPLPMDAVDAAIYRVPKLDLVTFYTKWGDWAGWLCLACSSLIVLLCWRTKQKAQAVK